MTQNPGSLLIVDGNDEFAALLASEADARAYRTRVVPNVNAALALIERESFDALLVDLAPGADGAFELLGRLRGMLSDAEVIVMSDQTSMAATIQWFDPDAFAFVRKSDIVQLFASLARALERRRITSQNRRLVWELQTINEIASGITKSLELEDVLTGALQRLVRAMDACGGFIRLRNELTGSFEPAAFVGPQALRGLAHRWPGLHRPSDQAIATRSAVIVEDFDDVPGIDRTALPLRSAISVPMMAGQEILGTLSLGSPKPRRFQVADQQLLAIIAGQIVVAVQNARLHQSVSRAKREWESTFDAISDPIAVFNNRGELLRGNQALADLLSRPVTQLRQLSCRDVGFCAGGSGHEDCAVTRALEHDEVRAEVTRDDGQIFSVTTFPIGLRTEGPSVVQVANNVTEEIRSARRLQQMSSELAGTNERLVAALDQLKSTQAQLVQAEKLSAIGQLVAGVAHELNNPLTSVIGYAQLVEEELSEGPSPRPADEVAQDLRRIAEESERAARIVRNLLAFARRQSTERAPQDVAEMCTKVLALRQYEFRMCGVDLETHFPVTLPKVLADSSQLQQVLLNLVLNAEHAMRGQPVRTLSISASFEPSAGAVELTIADSGHGIDAANLSRIFDPFFTTREVGQGTGLGLSICYGIVRDHGGHIRVQSKPRVGTTFRVLLPARLEDSSVAETEILVAHGEQSDREFICAALCGWGYRPLPAATLREAMEGYRHPSLRIAIIDRGILLDDPEAWEALRAADLRNVRMVLTSVALDDQVIERFGGEDAAVLVPPIELRALHAAIRTDVKECV